MCPFAAGLLRNLETNIRYFNNRQSRKQLNPDPDPNHELWKKWDDAGWAREGWADPLDTNNNMQRRAGYRDDLPRPPGVGKAVSFLDYIPICLISTLSTYGSWCQCVR